MSSLALCQALSLQEAVIEAGGSMGLPPLAIAILDPGGSERSTAAQEGTGLYRLSIARAKAATALGMGMGTRQLYDIFERGILPDRFANGIAAVADKGFLPQPGGLLIHAGGRLAGAIGISGASSDQDEAVARAGALAMGFQVE